MAALSSHSSRLAATPNSVWPPLLPSSSSSSPCRPPRVPPSAIPPNPPVPPLTQVTYALDMWSLGVVAYEFLVGEPPFDDETPEDIFENVVSRRLNMAIVNVRAPRRIARALCCAAVRSPAGCAGRHQMVPCLNGIRGGARLRSLTAGSLSHAVGLPLLPPSTAWLRAQSLSKSASSLVRQLLTWEDSERMTIEAAKRHPFFAHIDWERLRETEPSIKPAQRHTEDVESRWAGADLDKGEEGDEDDDDEGFDSTFQSMNVRKLALMHLPSAEAQA